MAGYAKFWTDMRHDPWFISLNCLARGLFQQLILKAKEEGDTGVISARNFTLLGLEFGCEGSTCRKNLGKFRDDGKLRIEKDKYGVLIITILNYTYWQEQHRVKGHKRGGKTDTKTEEISRKIPEKSATNRTEQNRTEQNRNNTGKPDPDGSSEIKKSKPSKVDKDDWNKCLHIMVLGLQKSHEYFKKFDHDTQYRIAGKIFNTFDRDLEITRAIFVLGRKQIQELDSEERFYQYLQGMENKMKERGDWGVFLSELYKKTDIGKARGNTETPGDSENIGQILNRLTGKL